MTNQEIRTAISTYLSASWTTTPIAWPNHKFDPSDTSQINYNNGYWIRPQTLFGLSQLGELGSQGVGIRNGILQVSLFAPKDSGVSTILGFADDIEDLFRRATSATLNGVIFQEADTDEKGIDEFEQYHVMTTIPFFTFIGE